MPLRSLLVALLLAACGHTDSLDARSDASAHEETAQRDASSESVAAQPDASTADVTPTVSATVTKVETARGAALPVIREAGRRWVVFASDLDDNAGDGAPVLVSFENDLAVTLRALKTRAMPARWREVPRTVWAHVDGRVCALELDAPAVLSRTIVDYALGEAWLGLDEDGRRVRPRLADDDLAREADALSSGGRMLAASVRNDACEDALVATVSPDAPERYARAAPDEALRRRAIAAYRATPAWADMQRQLYELTGDDGRPLPRGLRWDEFRNNTPDVAVWRAPSGRTFVTVTGDVASEGCGTFGGCLWAVYELDGDALVSWGADVTATFTPHDVVDADGDGRPEFLGDLEVRTLADHAWQTTTTLKVPAHVCAC